MPSDLAAPLPTPQDIAHFVKAMDRLAQFEAEFYDVRGFGAFKRDENFSDPVVVKVFAWLRSGAQAASTVTATMEVEQAAFNRGLEAVRPEGIYHLAHSAPWRHEGTSIYDYVDRLVARVPQEYMARRIVEAVNGNGTLVDAHAMQKAEATITAWRAVFQSIEAHLQDRIAMRDQADPETYLSIIQGEVERVDRESDAYVAARWRDSERYQAKITELEAEIARLSGATWNLNAADSERLVGALLNPPEPNEALKAAAARRVAPADADVERVALDGLIESVLAFADASVLKPDFFDRRAELIAAATIYRAAIAAMKGA